MSAASQPFAGWRGKRVFLTGHTGFKGSWLTLMLNALGARVYGYSLEPSSTPSMFDVVGVQDTCDHTIGDIRDTRALAAAMARAEPEVVFHLAAQPLVRRSYDEPIETFSTNVMGTLHVLDAARAVRPRAIVSVTTDKCYDNREWVWPYREGDPLGGKDPYSASKACAEIVSASWAHSFLGDGNCLLATARAGNVIGGGDWSDDRLIPDAVRAFAADQPLQIRNPLATRPWQHVLDPLYGYLLLADRLLAAPTFTERAFNFGPNAEQHVNVKQLADRFCAAWGDSARWASTDARGPYESFELSLDSSLSYRRLGWRGQISLARTIEWTAAWYRQHQQGASRAAMREITEQQIDELLRDSSAA